MTIFKAILLHVVNFHFLHVADGAKLEYTELFFSSSDYLCSLSGIPEFELTLWFV